jgi:2-hydroxychromene-2-carboxylate isomerase
MLLSVEFVFDFGSPNAYLAHLVIPSIEKRTGVAFTYLPALLGGIFKATGNVSPAVSLQGIVNKGEYQQLETRRFVARHGIERYAMNPHFPVNTLQLMRGALVAEREGILGEYVDACYEHMWAAPKKMDDPDVIRAAFEASKLPVDTLITGMADPEIKRKLIENTDAVVARGVFGSPSFFVGDELFFGKDRLREVEEEIQAAIGQS